MVEMKIVLAAVGFLSLVPTVAVAVEQPRQPRKSFDQEGRYIQSTNRNCTLKCEGDTKFPPICGSDGRVYENECELFRQNCRRNVSVTSWEACRGLHPLCPRRCLQIQDPVCGKDGKLYPNLCVMHSTNCGKPITTQPMKYCLAGVREFRSYQSCPDSCLDIYKPACGSNGVVYLNECYLRKHTCGQKVQLVGISQCVFVRKCPQMCVALYDPVCGSDGKLYLNTCRMFQENCGKKIQRMTRIYCQERREINKTS